MASPSLVQPYSSASAARIVGKTDLQTSDSKWVGLKSIDWVDEDGKTRKWESAERKTRSEGGIDAVSIFTLLQSTNPSTSPSTIIILQYRPPLQAICVEFPAGLIDKGETPEQAAVRELREETGYGADGKEDRVGVVHASAAIGADPGMSNANMKLVTLKVTVEDGELEPKAQLDEGEHIEKRRVPLNQLYEVLQGYEKLGYVVDARLSHFAWGLEVGKKYLKN
ncbi:hypothetical protein BT69DRAFT_1249214 [Atractiella rhizophila]|nr:hypothetical protein BT69DRAFT_1249214 [Atractiella rhizophila]